MTTAKLKVTEAEHSLLVFALRSAAAHWTEIAYEEGGATLQQRGMASLLREQADAARALAAKIEA